MYNKIAMFLSRYKLGRIGIHIIVIICYGKLVNPIKGIAREISNN